MHVVTFSTDGQAPERLLLVDFDYEQTLQLPLSWGLARADCIRLRKQSNENDGAASHVARKWRAATPHHLVLYLVHKDAWFSVTLTPGDVAAALENGTAEMQLYAAPVAGSSVNMQHDCGSTMTANGLLLNMHPAEARSVFDATKDGAVAPAAIPSHPIKSFGSLEIQDEPSSLISNTLASVRALLPGEGKQAGTGSGGPGGASERAEKEAEEAGEEGGSDRLQAAHSFLLHLVAGGLSALETHGLEVHVRVNLFPVAPPFLRRAIAWQQEHGLLPRNKLLAAWQLTNLAQNLVWRTSLYMLGIMLALATWMYMYSRVPLLNAWAGKLVELVYGLLPESVQPAAAHAWHLLLSHHLLHQVALGVLLTSGLLSIILVPLVLLFFNNLMTLLQHMLSPIRGTGVVYGLTVLRSRTLSRSEWARVTRADATRPDLAKGISNSGWITADIQERYWQQCDCSAKKASKKLSASSSWRADLGVDTILSSKQPKFHVIKSAFPHGVLCKGKDGHLVFAMRIGALHRQYHMLEKAELSNDEMVRHVAFMYEYFFRKLDTAELGSATSGRVINVLDLDGLGILDMQGKAAKLANLCSKVSEHHYPDRLHRAVLINCPNMINQVWGVVRNMLDENARSRSVLHTKDGTLKGLKEIMAVEDIPREWGGERECDFYGCDLEVGMFQQVANNNGQKLEDLAIDGLFDPSKISK